MPEEKKKKVDAADFAEPAEGAPVEEEGKVMSHAEAGGGEFIAVGGGKVIRVPKKPA